MFSDIPYNVKPSRVVNYLRFLEKIKGPTLFSNRKIEHFTESACWIFTIPGQYDSDIADLPISKVYGVSNRYKVGDGTKPNFKEVLFEHLNGYDAKFKKQWPVKILKYFLSSEDKGSLSGRGYLDFEAPGAGGEFSVSRVGQRYYAENGQHRIIAGMFYKHFKEGPESKIEGVKVNSYKTNNLYVKSALHLIDMSDDNNILVCKRNGIHFKLKLLRREFCVSDDSSIYLNRLKCSIYGRLRAYFYLLRNEDRNKNLEALKWFAIDRDYLESLQDPH